MEVFFLYLPTSLILTLMMVLYPYKSGKLLNLIDLAQSSELKIHKKDTSIIGGFIFLILMLNFFFYEFYIVGFFSSGSHEKNSV